MLDFGVLSAECGHSLELRLIVLERESVKAEVASTDKGERSHVRSMRDSAAGIGAQLIDLPAGLISGMLKRVCIKWVRSAIKVLPHRPDLSASL